MYEYCYIGSHVRAPGAPFAAACPAGVAPGMLSKPPCLDTWAYPLPGRWYRLVITIVLLLISLPPLEGQSELTLFFLPLRVWLRHTTHLGVPPHPNVTEEIYLPAARDYRSHTVSCCVGGYTPLIPPQNGASATVPFPDDLGSMSLLWMSFVRDVRLLWEDGAVIPRMVSLRPIDCFCQLPRKVGGTPATIDPRHVLR